MMVNGLKLPALLIELLETGRWQCPADASVLAAMTGAERPEEFAFDPLDSMIRETAGSVYLYNNGFEHIYNLTSSNASDRLSNPEALIVERSIVIAGNWAEETICLDYRDSLDEPSVVCGIWPDNRGRCYWKIIAPTFAAFAEQLGL
jgi:hypothetical protein